MARRSGRWRAQASRCTPSWPGSSAPTTATAAWTRSCWPRASGGAWRAAIAWPRRAGSTAPASSPRALGSTETTAQVHPARFTAALHRRRAGARRELRIGVVEDMVTRDGVASGVHVDGETLEADAVVLAMGPWTGRLGRLRAAARPRAQGLQRDACRAPTCPPTRSSSTTARPTAARWSRRSSRGPEGEVYVCGMADPAPLRTRRSWSR